MTTVMLNSSKKLKAVSIISTHLESTNNYIDVVKTC